MVIFMMTLQQVKEILNKASEKVGDTFSIEVSINGRLTRTLGRVTLVGSKTNGYEPTKMEFSKQLLETATDESIKEVILHEWTHYYITKTTGENHGHNAHFKALCQKVGGGSGATTTKVNRTVEVTDKYDVFCTCCGKKVGGYSRAGKTVKQPHLFTSGCCGGELKVIQNF